MASCKDCGKPTTGIRCHPCSVAAKTKVPREMCVSGCGRSQRADRPRTLWKGGYKCRQCRASEVARPDRSCEWCGGPLPIHLHQKRPLSDQRFCSSSCGRSTRRMGDAAKQRNPNYMSKVKFSQCPVCAEWFTVKRTGGITYCSAQCRFQNTLNQNREREQGIYAATRGITQDAAATRQELYRYLHKRENGLCCICWEPVTLGIKSGAHGSRNGPSVEHIIPRSMGGDDTIENLALSHWGCNADRRTRPLDAMWEPMKHG
jgi:HNH endonuclease